MKLDSSQTTQEPDTNSSNTVGIKVENMKEISKEESKDLKNQNEKEKTKRCIIDKNIVANVEANALRREKAEEIKKILQGKEADQYLRALWADINNLGKEIKVPESELPADQCGLVRTFLNAYMCLIFSGIRVILLNRT